ncbi:DNA topoisomerase VI subunit A [Aureococcus anophagefferens]|nr:DNA topoisomerase VI subunit A [Aureococcus anophagefferens]
MEDLEEEQDVTAWVNGVLSEASADGASVDAKISSVSMKLQIMAADLNDELEGHMEELIEAAPRALGDVGSVSRAAPPPRAAPRRRSTLLDRGAEAREPWDAAAGDVAAQLATMGDSERILRKLPDADDRRSTLDGLRDDFEHAAAARRGAAPDVSGETLRPLVALYERLGLGRRCGATTRPLGPRGAEAVVRADADGAGLDLAPWLAAFLDDLLRDLEAEKAAAGAAFGEAHAPGVAALVAARRSNRSRTRRAGRSAREWLAVANRTFALWRSDVAADAGRGRDAAFPRTRASRARRAALAAVAAAKRRTRRRRAEASPLDRVAVDRALDDLAAEASALAFECAFAPVRSALRRVSATASAAALKDKAAPYYCRAAVWAGNDDADPAPSDYATVVGEHLMGALRHLEPFLESPAVADAAAVHARAAA